ncbi:MAG: radical SAM protein [Candidatus Riflebacteria bacterium]|nr:radical SAM protein [Candidatus Riflebacteria bacterium]
MNKILVPDDYDYVGVYLTEKCHLNCAYCITSLNNSDFKQKKPNYLSSQDWIIALNRFVLPKDVPLTLQGGEPFLFKGIWEILEAVHNKMDILTALPSYLKKEHFLALKSLQWNQREAPYPKIRVSYHKGQNDYKELIERIAEFQEILSIGLYYLDAPFLTDEIAEIKKYAEKLRVDLRPKEFLGYYNGKFYGKFLYPDAALGEHTKKRVQCKNTVIPVSPEGNIFRCHSDLYFSRVQHCLGNVLDESIVFPGYTLCDNYGLCSVCDVKVKTNHYQKYGYTSVKIIFPSSDFENPK